MKYGFEKEWQAKIKAHGAAFEIAKGVALHGNKTPDMILKNFKKAYEEVFELIYEAIIK